MQNRQYEITYEKDQCSILGKIPVSPENRNELEQLFEEHKHLKRNIEIVTEANVCKNYQDIIEIGNILCSAQPEMLKIIIEVLGITDREILQEFKNILKNGKIRNLLLIIEKAGIKDKEDILSLENIIVESHTKNLDTVIECGINEAKTLLRFETIISISKHKILKTLAEVDKQSIIDLGKLQLIEKKNKIEKVLKSAQLAIFKILIEEGNIKNSETLIEIYPSVKRVKYKRLSENIRIFQEEGIKEEEFIILKDLFGYDPRSIRLLLKQEWIKNIFDVERKIKSIKGAPYENIEMLIEHKHITDAITFNTLQDVIKESEPKKLEIVLNHIKIRKIDELIQTKLILQASYRETMSIIQFKSTKKGNLVYANHREGIAEVKYHDYKNNLKILIEEEEINSIADLITYHDFLKYGDTSNIALFSRKVGIKKALSQKETGINKGNVIAFSKRQETTNKKQKLGIILQSAEPKILEIFMDIGLCSIDDLYECIEILINGKSEDIKNNIMNLSKIMNINKNIIKTELKKILIHNHQHLNNKIKILEKQGVSKKKDFIQLLSIESEKKLFSRLKEKGFYNPFSQTKKIEC